VSESAQPGSWALQLEARKAGRVRCSFRGRRLSGCLAESVCKTQKERRGKNRFEDHL